MGLLRRSGTEACSRWSWSSNPNPNPDPNPNQASRTDLDRSPRLAESLLFIDCTKAAAGGGGGLPNPFGMFTEKVVAQAGRMPDAALLSLAAG